MPCRTVSNHITPYFAEATHNQSNQATHCFIQTLCSNHIIDNVTVPQRGIRRKVMCMRQKGDSTVTLKMTHNSQTHQLGAYYIETSQANNDTARRTQHTNTWPCDKTELNHVFGVQGCGV